MKLILENWRQYITEDVGNTKYFWQTNGPWKSESQIEFGVTHVPKAKPRMRDGVEEIFEEVRKEKFPDRPSRFNCVYLCENLDGFSGRSFCRSGNPTGGVTYIVELRGDYNIFKTNAEIWSEAVFSMERSGDINIIKGYAESYWNPTGLITFGELLVSPPESAVIVGEYKE